MSAALRRAVEASTKMELAAAKGCSLDEAGRALKLAGHSVDIASAVIDLALMHAVPVGRVVHDLEQALSIPGPSA